MGLKPKISVSLVRCGRCGKRYSNPLGHVCRVSFTKTGAKKVAKPKGKR